MFGGNAAAVCLQDGPRDDAWLQALARELNVSSTTFVHGDGDSMSIRWFTVREELSINGTGTLGAAHILWQTGRLTEDVVHFQTRSGQLSATRDGDWVEIELPVESEAPADAPPDLLVGLGITSARYVGRSARNFYVELESAAAVRALEPTYATLARIEARGIVATSADETGEFDFISRYFAPSGGMNEDPVNGSSHACLGPFWQQRLGKDELLALQASPRGGVLRLRPRGDRVGIAGKAVTVFRGEILGGV